MKIHNFFSRGTAGFVLATVLASGQSMEAAVTFTVSPSSVSNTYNGYLTMQINGIASGSTVVLQKYLDANSNGVVDAGDFLIEEGNLTDGKASQVIGGVTNFNVPGDTDGATNGAITALFNFHNGDFLQYTVGQYIFVLTGTNPVFATNVIFNVTNFPYPQEFTGTVTNSSGTAVPNAQVIFFPPPRAGHDGPGDPLALVTANNSGVFNLRLPAGSYVPLAFKSNYVGNYSTAPLLTLNSGTTNTNNPPLISATANITGSYVDATNSGKGLPGVFAPLSSSTGLIVGTFTDTNGNFNVPVTAGTWSLGSDAGGLIIHGYVGYDNNPTNVSAGMAGVVIPFTKANALLYGNVSDIFGNPLAGIPVEAYGNGNGSNNPPDQVGDTDINGNYVVGMVGGTNSPYGFGVNDNAPTNYVFSDSPLNGTNINVGQVLEMNFTGILATNQISGTVKTNGVPVVGLGVYAYANIGTNYFQTQTVDTGSNGTYTLAVANTNTWYVTAEYCCNNDSLQNFGNYQDSNVSVFVSNNSPVANLNLQNCTGVVIFTTSVPNATEGSNYNAVLQGATCSGSQTWSVSSDPNGLFSGGGFNLNPNGTISGTPAFSGGPYSFTVMLTDYTDYGAATNQQLSLTINSSGPPPLQITTAPLLPGGTNGSFYSTPIAVSGGQSPYDWSLTSGQASLPAGLSLATNTGVISGTPTMATNASFTIQVTDSNHDVTNQTFSLTIVTTPLQIGPASPLPTATNGTFYSLTLTALNGQPPYNWFLEAGSANLPANLSLSTNGVISGVPDTVASNYLFIVGVVDSAYNYAYRQYQLNVTGSTPPPTLALVRQPGNGTLEFTFTSASGVNYSVQSSPDLKNWTTVLTFTGSGGTEIISVPTTSGAKAAYYQIKLGP